PTLSLKIGGSTKTIQLTGEGKYWSGEFIITESSFDNVIGTFSFSGTDFSGNTGTEIIEGKTIKIDTTAPTKVTDLITKMVDNIVKVSWKQVNQDVEFYYIFKESKSEIDINNPYRKFYDNMFYDTEIEEGKSYYYVIIAVDEAGNMGEASDFSKITITGLKQMSESETVSNYESVEEKDEIQLKSTYTTKRINDNLDTFKKLKKEYLKSKEKLFEKSNVELKVIEILDIESNIDKELSNLDKIISKLEELSKIENQDDTILDEIKTLEESIEKGKSKFIKNVVILEGYETKNTYDKKDISENLESFYNSMRMDTLETKKKEKNKDSIKTLNEDYDINRKIYSIYTTNYKEINEYYTFIQESVETDEDLKIISKIDETIVENLDEIISKDIEVKNKDRMRIIFKSSNPSYLITKKIPLNKLEKIITTLIPKEFLKEEIMPEEVKKEEEKKGITGLSISNIGKSIQNSGFVFGIFIIVGLLGYYFYITMKDEDGYSQHKSGWSKWTGNLFTKPNRQGTMVRFNSNEQTQNEIPKEAYDSFNNLVMTFNRMIEKNPPKKEKVNHGKEEDHGNHFNKADGEKIKDLYELAFSLIDMKPEVYTNHVDETKNDFAQWIRKLGEPELAFRVRIAKNKEEMGLRIVEHLTSKTS
ncbi:MAG: hypothetical protein U9R00_02960, partial [Patescibacteria group bacterium]|nr:hypothetical protein [Patescibacteria group bacterium]